MKIKRRKFLQNSLLAATAFTIAPFKITTEQDYGNTETESPRNLRERTLFAFDDHSIPWQHNLKITLVEAKKFPGNPVLRRGPKGAPDGGHVWLYGTVIKDGKKFRMWYLGIGEKGRFMCYAESTDGINWIKPELGLVDFNGNKRNNICLIEGPLMTRVGDFLSVLYEPEDPDPLRRYKVGYITGIAYKDIRGGMSNVGIAIMESGRPLFICCATGTSADGLSWRVVGDRPVNAEGECFEGSSIYRFGDFYYFTGQLHGPWSWLPDGRDAGRLMMAYRSPDFLTWSKAKAFSFARPGQLINPAIRIQGQQTHMGAGLWNRNNVLVGLYGMWQDGPGRAEYLYGMWEDRIEPAERPKGEFHLLGTHINLGLIVSNDGIHFREPVPDFKIISHGKEGEWDDVSVLQGNAFVNEGDQTMIWYSHGYTGGNFNQLKPSDIGLATLRRDGFGYLSRKEDDNDAHFITTTLEARKKERLIINVDGLTAEAPLTVELLDNQDKPMEGYSGQQAAVLTSSGTQLKVSWSGENYLPVNRKFAIRVKFPVNSSAKVYALYITQS